MSHFDIHILLRCIANSIEGTVKLIPLTTEKYIGVIKFLKDTNIRYSFMDSTRFLSASLDSLIKLLDDDKKYTIKSFFKDPEEFKLVSKKGILCYDYIKNFNVLDEPNLPLYEKFYNKMNDCNIPKEDYQHALKVYEKFNCKSLKDYTKIYLLIDVLALVDVYLAFRDTMLKTHKLDICHFFTLASYSFDACLRKSKVELELITDIDILLFFERAIRGGLVQASVRKVEANNCFMKKYDSTEESVTIGYFDANGLYSFSMIHKLPHSEFEFIEDITNFNIHDIPENSDTGYLIECDISYPKEIHNKQNYYPMMPIRSRPPHSKQEKLMATLLRKEKYVVYYLNLQLALKHGIVLEKTHRILKFKQIAWTADYIKMNIELRKQATNDFDKNLFKILNNSLYGKTIEAVKNRRDIRLINRWNGRYNAENLISKPNFKRYVTFGDDLIAVEMNKLNILMDKPIYAGCIILEISKLIMNNFFYNYLQPTFGDKLELSYTDTDSFLIVVKGLNMYDYIKRDAEKFFDTSDLPPDNIHNIPIVNKKCLGMFKDELKGKIIIGLAAVRAKQYSLEVQDQKDILRNKGVKKSVVERCLTHKDYVNCLENDVEKCVTQDFIRSHLHNVYTIREKKLALSANDDKRYIIKTRNSKHQTLPWGHYKIDFYEEQLRKEEEEEKINCN